MAHKTMVGGTNYDITGGRTMVDGTVYSIQKGKAMVDGTVGEIAFARGTPVSQLAVGDGVYTVVNGVKREFLIVQHGKPSGQYSDTCDGVWLLMKDTTAKKQEWNSSDSNMYETSTIHKFLNGTFLDMFDADIKAQIKTVKLPYRKYGGQGGTTQQGENGLSAKIFLLSGPEVNIIFHGVDSGEGAALSYFSNCTTNGADGKRIACQNGLPIAWWLRSPNTSNYDQAWTVDADGSFRRQNCSVTNGIRPAFIIDGSVCVDENYNLIG
jgi:hypothetical protein